MFCWNFDLFGCTSKQVGLKADQAAGLGILQLTWGRTEFPLWHHRGLISITDWLLFCFFLSTLFSRSQSHLLPPIRPARCPNWRNNWLRRWDRCRWDAYETQRRFTWHIALNGIVFPLLCVRSAPSGLPKSPPTPSWRWTRRRTWASSSPTWWTWCTPGPTAPPLHKSARWRTCLKVRRLSRFSAHA